MKGETKVTGRIFRSARFLNLLLLFFNVWITVHAQEVTINLMPLSISDHFSQNTIQTIYQDSYGFMWFGTQDGLNKYDGYQIEVFKSRQNDLTSLSANHITAISEDQNGDLWIGTRTGGVNKYDRAKDIFTRFLKKEGDPNSIHNDQVNVIFKDSQANIWIGTPDGLHRVAKNGKSFQRISLQSATSPAGTDEVRSIYEDRQHNMWIGTNKGLKQLRRNAGTVLYYQDRNSSSQDDTIDAICEDESGNIWIGCASGLKMFNKQKRSFYKYTVEPDINSVGGLNPVSCLLNAANNKFWLGSNTTLQLFDIATKKIIKISDRTDGDSRMPNDGIYSLFKDSAGVLWIGTSSQGVLKLDQNLTTFQSFKSSLVNIASAKNIIRSLDEDGAGNLYIATDAGLEYFDRTKLSYKKYTHQSRNPNSLSSNYTTSVIHSQKSGLVWVGTYSNGLDVFDPRLGTFKHFTKGAAKGALNSNAIDILLEDRGGRIWIGTDGGGLNQFDPATGIFTKFLHGAATPSNGLCDNTILALYEDKKGSIWIGGYSKGISIFDSKQNTFSQLNTANSKLSMDIVSCFYEDSNEVMWIGTQGGGLNRYDPKTGLITIYNEDNGLINNSVNYICADAFGTLWLTTNSGITSFEPIKGIFRNFGKNNNLKSLEFNLGAGTKLSTGEIAVGSINGFTIIDPSRLAHNKHKPNIVLTGLQLFNRPVGVKTENSPLKQTLLTCKEIELDYAQSVFTVTFAALDYTSPESNQYAYILEGFDKDWSHTGNVHNATYTNLNPGTYTLRVRASNNDGLWSDKEASVVIRIRTPYWMSWWFKFALISIVATGAYLFYYYRLKYERRQKTKLELLVRRRTAKIRDQSSHLEKLNQELVHSTASLGELNNRLKEQKQQERNARLAAESAQKQADAANSAKSTFLATMSHELRTPINGVMGMASLLTETALDNEQKEYAEAIINSGESLLSVINDVLDFSKIESGNIELESHHFGLRKCIEDVLELFGPKVAESAVDLLYLIGDQVPDFIIGDSLRLRQILINMVGNAVKFTERGDVLIKVTLDSESNDHLKLCFQIQDTGIGIPKSQQKNLFRAFHQLDSSVTRKYGGSGLGLVICERLVRLMGGMIEVESDLGSGSTFSFVIDCQRGQNLRSSGQQPDNTIFSDKCALIINDNPNSLQALKSQLTSLKINVITAASGAQALQTLAANKNIDLVITDMQMPDMTGLQLANSVNELPGARPIILLASLRDGIQSSNSSLFGAVISKPVRQSKLLRSVNDLLKMQNSPQTEVRKTALPKEFASQYPYKILVAEDILLNQKLIVWVLNKLGYQPDLANNGREVLEMMEVKEYELILMDLQMPEMDGLEATLLIRQIYGQRPFIVALTANAMSEDRQNCIGAGMNDYMPKPINLEVLKKCLKTLSSVHPNTP
ncbi:hybrid sensor histidine kinase/response regulator [Dyadobacter psychrotolerans]|uniref:Sensory/regulatory protein RpfC n=1 Tax=Dyadobacter psychrotolerans TaxID=2541721 RepID=A0A4R5D680_9BACT|nr:hybrid sensor histidine kinase/response regulator [Dyadobacter psychrotolerans]TDE09002.1 response regulator [Dyadobacter psychrotolerans]